MDKLGRMKMHKLLLLAVACSWALSAAAQWQWIDKDGRKVFSDRPPPQEIPEKSILKQPSGGVPRTALPTPPTAPGAEGAPATAAAASAAAPVPKPGASAPGSGKDKALEEKKAQAEAAEAAKKKAEEEKLAKAKSENCNRARQAKAAFEAGRPITQSNAQGERIFLDEAGRAAEAKRIDGIIASDCKR
jgi:type IV secretory pathway VirB10-like protein